MTRNITETKCFTPVVGAAPERTRPQVSRGNGPDRDSSDSDNFPTRNG